MSFELIVRPDAEQDILEAYGWYETQLAGLGLEYLNSIEAVFELIRENPSMFQVVF